MSRFDLSLCHAERQMLQVDPERSVMEWRWNGLIKAQPRTRRKDRRNFIAAYRRNWKS